MILGAQGHTVTLEPHWQAKLDSEVEDELQVELITSGFSKLNFKLT